MRIKISQEDRILSSIMEASDQSRKNKLLKGSLSRFFKTAVGEYAEGDQFLDIPSSQIREVARRFIAASLDDCARLLKNPYHEVRLAGLFIVVERQKRTLKKIARGGGDRDFAVIQQNLRFYLGQLLKKNSGINNWDLIDLSAPWLLGESLLALESVCLQCILSEFHLGRQATRFAILHGLSKSKDLWHRRAAMCSNLALIKRGILEPTWEIGLRLSGDCRDLNQKVVGWILREAGKKDEAALLRLIKREGARWPRTLLRSAIEKIEEPQRREILRKTRERSRSIDII